MIRKKGEFKMAIEVYVTFNGNCREAVEFYSEVFDAPMNKILTFGEGMDPSDYQLTEEQKQLVMHTELIISENRIMFSDAFPGHPVTVGNNITLTILSNDKDEITTWFDRLKEGGTVEMELQETFWSKHYGVVVDRFGIFWQFSYVG